MTNNPTPPPTNQDRPAAELLTRRHRPEPADSKAANVVDLLGMPGAEVEFEPVRFDLTSQPVDLN